MKIFSRKKIYVLMVVLAFLILPLFVRMVHADSLNTISGTLIGTDSQPISNADLSFVSTTNTIGDVHTNSDGTYSINMPPGSYSVYLGSIGNLTAGTPSTVSLQPGSSSPIDIMSGDAVQNLKLDGVVITATLKDSDGVPVAGYTVGANAIGGTTTFLANDSSELYTGSVYNSATTDAGGVASILVLKGMDYSVCAYTPANNETCDPTTVTASTDSSVDITLPVTHTVSGTFLGTNGQPVPNASLSFSGANGNLGTTSTASDGTYSVSLVPDEYNVSLIQLGTKTTGTPDAVSLEANSSLSIDLTTGDTTQDLQFDGAVVTVTVKNSDGVPAGAGYGVELNANEGGSGGATFLADNSSTIYSGNVSGNGVTDNDGTVSVLVLKGLSYTICASTPANIQTCNATQLMPTSDSSTDVTLPVTHTVSGTFTDADGQPVVNADLQFVGANNNYGDTHTASDGTYSVSLVPDEYSVSVGSLGAVSGGTPETASLQPDSTTPIDLTSGDATQNLQLSSVTITITVKDSDGNPVEGYLVSANATGGSTSLLADDSSDRYTGNAYNGGNSGSDGTISLLVLKGMTYSVCAYALSGVEACDPTPLVASADSSDTVYVDAPDAPTNVSGSAIGGDVTLSWDATPATESYNIYRDGEKIGNSSTTSYSDTGLVDGNYIYTIKAVNPTGLSSVASSEIAIEITN